MDSLVEKKLFGNKYSGKRVFVTGHTGFKGSWLAMWLRHLGADVCGYSLVPPTNPSHFETLKADYKSITGDIRDIATLKEAIAAFQPHILFHMAAQPLVRLSYREPLDTFTSNIIGTANVLEASRYCGSLEAIVIITTDKCYENREWVWGYRENDALGGYDPYSASKACAELVVASCRNSFFNPEKFGREHHVLIATARAGNVIGGGDWAADRLIPDLIRGVAGGRKQMIRNPGAVRPWQHVLESLSGYLALGQKLLEGKVLFSGAWNFAPSDNEMLTVDQVVNRCRETWNKIDFEYENELGSFHETTVLRLDCSKAKALLEWHSTWPTLKAIDRSVNWYRLFYEERLQNSLNDLTDYIADATARGLAWTKP